MKTFPFLVMLLFAIAALAMANATVDFGATTTSAETLAKVLESLALPAWTYIALRALIAVMSAIKTIFPNIDKH